MKRILRHPAVLIAVASAVAITGLRLSGDGGAAEPLLDLLAPHPDSGRRATLVGADVPATSRQAPADDQASDRMRLLSDDDRRFVPGRLVVRFRDDISEEQRAGFRRRFGLRRLRGLPIKGAEVVALPRGLGPAEAALSLHSRPEVAYVEPEFIFRLLAVPNDPYFQDLWGLRNEGQTVAGSSGTAGADIDAPAAWDVTAGSERVTVAVVDTGVAYDHPDLAPNMWRNARETRNGIDDDGNQLVDDLMGWDWVNGDADPYDFNGHGTHVAGTVAAAGNDGTGVAGVSWRARVMPLRALNAEGWGTSSAIAEAFLYAGRAGAQIVNASLGGPSFSRVVSDAILASPGTLFAVAAGNGGGDGIGDDNDQSAVYPCNYVAPNILCVAATDQNDALARFSNFGASSVHLAAPGVGIVSDQPSFDEPLVSEDFEQPLTGRWTPGGMHSAWARSTAVSRSPSNSLADSPAGSYANGADAWVGRDAPVDLRGKRGCRVLYALRLDTQPNADRLLLEGSETPNGPWTALGTRSGSTGGVLAAVWDDASRFDGRTLHLRFRLVTDGSITGDGAYIDDVRIRCMRTPTGDSVAVFNGTSMATPHVAGTAALVWDVRPTATVAEVKESLVAGADPLTSLQGATASGARLNALRSLGGPPPAPQLTQPSVPFQRQTSIGVAWRDPNAESGLRFDVRYRQATPTSSFASSVDWQTDTSATSATFPGVRGSSYCFEARSRRSDGSASDWSSPRCTSLPIDDRALVRSGSWTRATGTQHYLSTVSVASARGVSLTISGVRGRQIALVAQTCPACGTVDVLFNGALLKRISLDRSRTTARRVLPVAVFAATRSGTVVIRVVTSDRRVFIDGLGLQQWEA